MAAKLDETSVSASAPNYTGAVFDHSPIGMAGLDAAGALRVTNPALQRLLGLPADALVGQSLASLLHPADRATCVSSFAPLVAHGGQIRIEVRLRASADAERWVRIHLSRGAVGTTGSPAMVGTFEEVTDEKAASAEFQSTTRRLQQLVDSANDIIFNVDVDGRFTWVNPTASRLMKRPMDELVGTAFLELVRPDYRRDAAALYAHQVSHQIPSTYYEFPAVAADGEVIWLGQYVQLILDGDRIANIQAVARNITARKHAEDQLRAAEERVRAVVSNAPIILWAADRDGVFTLCEGHGLKSLGIEPYEAVGQKVSDIYTDPTVEAHLQRALQGETFQAEITLGGPVFDSWYSALRDADRVIQGVIGVAVDITEHVQLSQQLREAQKMEAIGQLAGGVAHDFNNQLTAVLGFAEMLQQSFDKNDPRAEDVEQIIRGGQRAAALTEQLLAFGRRQPRRLTVLDLNAIVTGLEPLLVHSIREDVQLDTQLHPHLYPVTADEVQMEQVIMNLALNARDAMPTGGKLTIRTTNVTLDDAQVRERPPLAPGDYAVIAVVDTGEGIDEETKAHLFEPFFTTKEQGLGTGMGLASAYGIITQSGGIIEVTSEVGQGATFACYLPSSGVLETHPATITASAKGDVAETILVVEYDRAVQEMITAGLAGAGYTVLAARTSEQALEAEATYRGPLALLLTDVVLPQHGGRDLANQISLRRPNLKVLFITSYAGDPSLRDALDDATHEVIETPFSPSDLVLRVRALLDYAGDRAAVTTPQT